MIDEATDRRRDGWRVPALLAAAGVIIRLAWLAGADATSQMIGEANNVAISFARTGTFADAFRPGQGPTAHVMPLMPVVAGSVYRAVGIGTSAANLVLTLVALALLVVTWLALYRATALAGLSRPARLGALGLLTLVPFNVAIETVEFRVWEGGLAAALGATLLWHALWLDGHAAVPTRRFVVFGLHAAVTLFVSPALGLAGIACGALLMARRAPPRQWPAIIVGVAAVTLVVLAPWTIRNAVVLHRPIALRDNFGLEFGQAFYAGAERPGDARAKFQARHHAIHPYQPAGNAALVAAGGEVAYYDALGAAATAWVRDHPAAALAIAAGHLRDLLFPPAWYWSQFGRTGTATLAKLVLNWAITAAALVGLVHGWRRAGARFTYVAAMIALPLLPYLAVEPTLRYRYLIVNLLVFVAAGPVAAGIAALAVRPRRGLAAAGPRR